jgi:phytoene dehydrogenase-like protein
VTARYDVVVIGAGHNGLVAAGYLAKAGLRVLVAERSDRVGGILAEHELEPGVRAPALVHTVGRLRPSVIRDLSLGAHGLRLIRPGVRAFAPHPDGGSLTLWGDPARTAEELRQRSAADAAEYPRFDARVRSIASFLAHLNAATPPDLDSPSLSDAIAGLRFGRLFRKLGPKTGREALRVLPMPVADLVGERFERDEVSAAIAARGVQFTAMGPWTAGTAAVLLNDSAGNDGGAPGQTVFAAGGPAAVAEALARAARALGAEIRTGAEVASIATNADGRATGVTLAGGEEIAARAVVSAADPKRTMLGLIDPVVLGPTMVWRIRNLRAPGCTAKVNLSLSGLPRFAGLDGDERLRGRIVIAPSVDHLERGADAAKYGRVSDEPYLEAVIPTLSDSSLAPEGRHVMSVLVQWAPFRLRDGEWEKERDGLGDLVLKTLETFAPGLSGLVSARQVLTPADLEAGFGLSGGHVLHLEPGLDQFFAWRPLLGYARYRMPVEGLYLCGSGAHPGGGITGAPGANAAREILSDLSSRRR